MTGKERLRCTMRHEQPDRVPIFEFLYSRPFYKEVLGFVPKVFGAETIVACSQKVGYDLVFIPMGGVSGFNAKEDSGEIYTDEWGITYKKDPATWPIDATIKYPMQSGADWESYTIPDPHIPSRYDGIKTALAMCAQSGTGVVGTVRGPYSAAWMLFGFENFFYMMYDDPDTVDAVLTATTDFAITGGLHMAALGVDALLFADDYGSNTQTFFSLPHFDRFILPHIKRMCDAFAQVDMQLIMHSDGHVTDLVERCVDAGIKGLHPIQRTAGMDIGAIKREFGDRITIFGNIDNSDLLVNGTPQQVAAQVKECIALAASGGGYCLGSDHSIHDDVPNENVFAIYEAGRKHGKYPISSEE
ncbi:MAG: hypothetical protein HN389_02270 [Clostridia bacterium]|nr:hypothetical protein [Clostridia bacterium]